MNSSYLHVAGYGHRLLWVMNSSYLAGHVHRLLWVMNSSYLAGHVHRLLWVMNSFLPTCSWACP